MNTDPSSPMIRAIANTLCDHDVDVINERNFIKIVTVLINSGWSAKDIHSNIEPAIMMAAIRQRNNAHRNYWLKQVIEDDLS
jgi:hypothetical protein